MTSPAHRGMRLALSKGMRRIKTAAGKLMLLTGNPELGLSRQRILENEGFHVVAPQNAEAAADRLKSQRFDTMVVCHSINAQHAATLVSMFRNANPAGRVVAITLLGTMPEGFAADRAVSGIESPTALLDAVRELTTGHSTNAGNNDSA